MRRMPTRINAGSQRSAIRAASITLFLLFGIAAQDLAGPTTAPVVNVRVTHVISDRFPELSEADLASVLKTASEMIAAGYRREVRFVAAKRAKWTAADYFGEMDRHVLPYKLSRGEHFDVFADKLE